MHENLNNTILITFSNENCLTAFNKLYKLVNHPNLIAIYKIIKYVIVVEKLQYCDNLKCGI